jgi:hypothetical protein
MHELVVVSEHVIPGASPRFQFVLRDPRDRLERAVVPLQQLFIAEGRHVLSHGPEGYVGGHAKVTATRASFSRIAPPAGARAWGPEPHGSCWSV